MAGNDTLKIPSLCWMEANAVHDLVFVNNLGVKKNYNIVSSVRLGTVQVQPANGGGLPKFLSILCKKA